VGDTELASTHVLEPVVRHQQLEPAESHLVHAAQVAVHGVEARHRAARELDEQWVCSQRLEPKHALLADHVGVEQQPELSRHRVDDAAARLELVEHQAQRPIDAESSHVHAERHQATDARQRLIGGAGADTLRVTPANATPSPLELVAQRPLVSQRPPAHPWGSWPGASVRPRVLRGTRLSRVHRP
jgi:hypothetical protein